MNSFAVVLLLAAAASAAYMPSAGVKRFALLGHPGAVELADIPSVYEKPTIVAVKSELEPEIVAYLAKNGLSGLAKSPETRHLHEFLMTGEDKVGVVLSKSLSAPELELPVRAVHLPEGYTLADAARTQAENSPLRVVLLHHPAEVRKSPSLAKLALVGDFEVTEDSIRAAPAIHAASAASPVSAKLVARLAADESAAVPSDSIIAIRANKLSSPITGIRTVPVYAKNAPKYAVEYASKYAPEYASATPVAAYPVIAGKFASAGPAAAHDGAVTYIRSTPADSARLISYPSSAAIESVAAYPSAKAASYVAIPASRAHAKPAVYESDEAAYISAIPSASGKVAISYPSGTPIEAVDVSAAVPATRHHHHLHVYESPAAAGLSSLASPSYIVA